MSDAMKLLLIFLSIPVILFGTLFVVITTATVIYYKIMLFFFKKDAVEVIDHMKGKK